MLQMSNSTAYPPIFLTREVSKNYATRTATRKIAKTGAPIWMLYVERNETRNRSVISKFQMEKQNIKKSKIRRSGDVYI